MDSESESFKAGPHASDHDLLRVIGRGSYGEVWLARHRTLGTLRAVKVVRRADFEEERPFRREVRLGNFAIMPCYSEARRDSRFQALLREAKLMPATIPSTTSPVP